VIVSVSVFLQMISSPGLIVRITGIKPLLLSKLINILLPVGVTSGISGEAVAVTCDVCVGMGVGVTFCSPTHPEKRMATQIIPMIYLFSPIKFITNFLIFAQKIKLSVFVDARLARLSG
jgi:hypothetical protein